MLIIKFKEKKVDVDLFERIQCMSHKKFLCKKIEKSACPYNNFTYTKKPVVVEKKLIFKDVEHTYNYDIDKKYSDTYKSKYEYKKGDTFKENRKYVRKYSKFKDPD
jgi:hypothetical protein